jgi:glycosyltransferase involved in cell wall biosynthesis
MECLLGQNYPRTDFEILIVDNGSEDGTYPLALQLQSEHPGLVVALLEERRGSYAARNLGIKAASGLLLCFLDADVLVDHDYLSCIQTFFDDNEVDYVGVNVEVLSQCHGIIPLYERLQGFPVASYVQELHFVPTCCLSVKHSLIDRIGVFDERLESGGDLEFGQRAYAQGVHLAYCGEVKIYHPARETWGQLSKKSRRVFRGIAQLYYYLPNRYRGHFWSAFLFSWWPRNPFKVGTSAREKQIRVSLLETLILSSIKVPLGICGLFVLLKEFWQMKRVITRPS